MLYRVVTWRDTFVSQLSRFRSLVITVLPVSESYFRPSVPFIACVAPIVRQPDARTRALHRLADDSGESAASGDADRRNRRQSVSGPSIS
jgi:hypothetical protein